MTFEQMKTIEPELGRLERNAEHAGRNGASWTSYLLACHEALTKLTGRGAQIEQLQDGRSYETARAALFASWSKGRKQTTDAPCCCIDAMLPNTAHSEVGYRHL